jgi:phage repressor protein C with HTH and peptisase S24 domain
MAGQFGQRLKAAMKAADVKNVEIARVLGITASSVSQWISGDTVPRDDKIVKLAELLKVKPEELAGRPIRKALAAMPLNAVAVAAQSTRDLPVYAAAEGGSGAMIISQSAIEYTYRSETSRGPECFAVHVIGDSMEPAFFQGEQVVVDPRRVPAAGDDCIFINDADPEWRAIVKRLLRASPDKWRVRQYNPTKDYELSRTEWTRALKIIEKRFR